MKFFEFQRNARGQTRRLLCWFAIMVVLLVLAVNAVMALAWWLTVAGYLGYPSHFFAVNTGVVLLFVLGGWWMETSNLEGGGVKLAQRLGAREARPSQSADEQRYVNIVNELAIAAQMRAPQAMVLARESSINAFATGWGEQDAVVAVTQGALDALTREEMQGLVAHELSHIREGDTRLNMRLAGMVFGLEMIYRMGQAMIRPDDRGRRHLWLILGFAVMSVGWPGMPCRPPCRVSGSTWPMPAPFSGHATATGSGVCCVKSWVNCANMAPSSRWNSQRFSTCCWSRANRAGSGVGWTPIRRCPIGSRASMVGVCPPCRFYRAVNPRASQRLLPTPNP